MFKNSFNIDDVLITPLKTIRVPNGNVMHGMKSSDVGYDRFGEAYFSTINSGAIKAWKRHKEMTINLVVPSGKVKFVLYDDRQISKNLGSYLEVIISKDNFCRLTIPPMIWVGFQGLDIETSIILNIANIEHSPEEVDKRNLDEILYDWELY